MLSSSVVLVVDARRVDTRHVTHQEIDAYFAQIPLWMKTDISREIGLARASRSRLGRFLLTRLGISPGGGNLLGSLGLVAYSEALGRIRRWNRLRLGGSPEECFLAFFDEMNAGAYLQWRLGWESAHPQTSLYEALRCGLAHEYQPKVGSAFHIAEGDSLGLVEENDVLIFKVEPYYRHFCAEVDRLYAELKAMPRPEIPPPQFRKRQQPIASASSLSVPAASTAPTRGVTVAPTSNTPDT